MDDEERAALDGEIRRYMAALPAKVEGVAAIFRQWKAQLAAINSERDRLAVMAKRVEGNEVRLKGYVAEVLALQPEPKKGCRKLVGSQGAMLMLKGNGGVQPLVISDESLVPDEHWDVVVTMPLIDYREAHKTFLQYPAAQAVNKTRVRVALGSPCQSCGGGQDRLEHERTCPACGGTGLQGVPGAHLEPRGQHVEVK
jgi:hypothetical protein